MAVEWALTQVGTPYVWGGETPGVGFDCSGLVQAAYRVAGVTLPRVAQDQFDATPAVPAGQPLEPGDLVFFGGGPTSVDHVGLYVGVTGGQAVMVDAPQPGRTCGSSRFPPCRARRGGALLRGRDPALNWWIPERRKTRIGRLRHAYCKSQVVPQ